MCASVNFKVTFMSKRKAVTNASRTVTVIVLDRVIYQDPVHDKKYEGQKRN